MPANAAKAAEIGVLRSLTLGPPSRRPKPGRRAKAPPTASKNPCYRITPVQIRIAAALGAVLTLAEPLTAQFPAYRAPHMADGHPDLNGLWQAFVTANFDLQDHEAKPGPHPEVMGAYGGEPAGQSIVEGGDIPYQPWALAKKKQNFEKRTTVDVSSDKKWHEIGAPEFKCYMPGVPRATYMP